MRGAVFVEQEEVILDLDARGRDDLLARVARVSAHRDTLHLEEDRQRAGSGERSGVERDGRDQLYAAQVQGRDALYPVRAGRVKKFSGNRARLLTARKKRYTIDLFQNTLDVVAAPT